MTCVWSQIGQMARHFHPTAEWHRGFFWFQSVVLMMRKVASENWSVKRKSEETDETEHPKETRSEMEWFWETRNTWQSSATRATREKCACTCVRWGVVCTFCRVHACCDSLSVKSEKNCKTSNGIRAQVDFDNNRDLLARQQFPEAILSVNLSSSFLPFVPPLFVLPSMRVPFLPLMVPRWRIPPRWAWWPAWR